MSFRKCKCKMERGKWTIVKVPFECGCDRVGASLAPRWLEEKCGSMHGEVLCLEVQRDKADKERFGVKNYEEVVSTCTALRDIVARLCTESKRVLTIGGDHSIALGSVSGVLEHDANIGVIWFDAHGDVNTEATSPSKNAHGMPVAALMGICTSGLNEIARVHLRAQNIFWVGARDLDAGEKETIERLGIADNVYSTERVYQMGMDVVIEEIRRKMDEQGIKAIHLSFDIDGMDPSIVWATGTRVEDGLLQEDLDVFIRNLQDLPPMKSLDFVEYNPLLDDAEHTTGKWCVKTLKQLIDKLKI